jgi:hypothetical protein
MHGVRNVKYVLTDLKNELCTLKVKANQYL